jgi:hypothetical protein
MAIIYAMVLDTSKRTTLVIGHPGRSFNHFNLSTSRHYPYLWRAMVEMSSVINSEILMSQAFTRM